MFSSLSYLRVKLVAGDDPGIDPGIDPRNDPDISAAAQAAAAAVAGVAAAAASIGIWQRFKNAKRKHKNAGYETPSQKISLQFSSTPYEVYRRRAAGVFHIKRFLIICYYMLV